jgi:rhodanese-related sulfurtransferase
VVGVALVALGLGFLAWAGGPGWVDQGLKELISLRHPEVPWVEPEQLRAWMRDEPAPLILDVRTAAEFEVSHLPGAIRVEPEGPLPELPPHEGPVVVYCSVGWRSATWGERLRQSGERPFNLVGGIFEWANLGQPLVGADGSPTRWVHGYDAKWERMLRPDRRAPLPE